MPEISRFFGIIIRMFAEPAAQHRRPLPFLPSIPSKCSAENCLSASNASLKPGRRFTGPNCRKTGSGFRLDGPLSRSLGHTRLRLSLRAV